MFASILLALSLPGPAAIDPALPAPAASWTGSPIGPWVDPGVGALAGPALSGDDFDDRYRAAKNDAGALWELYKWCLEQDGTAEEANKGRGARLLRRIIRLDAGHLRARQALGHIRVDGQWFANEKALARHRRALDEAEPRREGW